MSEHAKPRCPICGKPRAERFRPFCSTRCANVDLSRWLGGTYAVPAVESEAEGLDLDGGAPETAPEAASWTAPGRSSKRPPPRQKPR